MACGGKRLPNYGVDVGTNLIDGHAFTKRHNLNFKKASMLALT